MAEAHSFQSSAFSPREEAAGRAAHAAFCHELEAWMHLPLPTLWELQSDRIKRAWIAAAAAARGAES
jgi:hypothetical protein